MFWTVSRTIKLKPSPITVFQFSRTNLKNHLVHIAARLDGTKSQSECLTESTRSPKIVIAICFLCIAITSKLLQSASCGFASDCSGTSYGIVALSRNPNLEDLYISVNEELDKKKQFVVEALIEAMVQNSSGDGEWTVVLPSKGRLGRRKKAKPKSQEEEEDKLWKSDDLEVDPERQAIIKQKMEVSMKKMQSSKFYAAFLEQLKSPEVSDQFRLVLGANTQLQMVIYGIGSIESSERPRLQLSIAILMKREFDWVGDNVEVFDPVLSGIESSVLESLGCTVLSVNENARREALKPTLFFMPHCEANLYSNLLQANWSISRLSRIALFGNSFQMYAEQVSFDTEVIRATKRIIAARRITTEFVIDTVSDDYFAAFHDSSWHFFSSGIDSELPLLVSEGL